MQRDDPSQLEESYDNFPRIEETFQVALDESLRPRGPDSLFDIVAALGLPRGAAALDLGCGEGKQSVELAKRFGFSVLGIDPVFRNLDVAEMSLAAEGELRALVRFERGSTSAIPAPENSFDLVWCREVLVLVSDLGAAFAECRRVLRPGGHMFIHDTFATEPLNVGDAAGPIPPPGASAPAIEAAFTAAGFEVQERIELGSEWGQWGEETDGRAGRRLVHAARLLHDTERYVARFGQANYDIMLADCLWHVYRMIGKLSGRVYVLRQS